MGIQNFDLSSRQSPPCQDLPFPLRSWQLQAQQHYFALRQKNFLADICPGSGKTIFGCSVALGLLEQCQVKQIVVVVHTDHLRWQWIQEAEKLQLRLTTSVERTTNHDGFVLTYQQLANPSFAASVHRVVQGDRRTLVLFDEIHHVSDSRAWGDGIQVAFRKAWLRLMLSGTPFRQDEARIPYIRYVGGVGQSDFSYGYGEALQDGIVAPVFFPTFGGSTTWKMGDREFAAKFGDRLNQIDAVRQLNTAISDRTWLAAVLQDASQRLMELRRYHASAGGLAIAKDQDHARQISRLLKGILGESPVLVMSDVEESQALIAQFKESDAPWIVAVRMVSEGVDIPRLRVGVYATNVRTELFFRQVVGRLIRLCPGSEDQSVYLYVPQHPILQEHARNIARDRQHVLKTKTYSHNHGWTEPVHHLTPVSANAIAGGILLPGGEFSEAELLHAQQVRQASGLTHLSVESVARILRAQATLNSSS